VELNVKSVFLARQKKRVKCLNFCHVDGKREEWILVAKVEDR